MSEAKPSGSTTEAELRARVAFLESRVASLERELATKSPSRAAAVGHSGAHLPHYRAVEYDHDHYHHQQRHDASTPHRHGETSLGGPESPYTPSQSGRTVTRHRFSHHHPLGSSHQKHPYSVGHLHRSPGPSTPHRGAMRHPHWAHSPGGQPPTPSHLTASDPRTLGGVVGGTLGMLSPLPDDDLPHADHIPPLAATALGGTAAATGQQPSPRTSTVFETEPGGRLGGDAATMSPNTAINLGISKKLPECLGTAAAGAGPASLGGLSGSSPLNSPSPSGAAVLRGSAGTPSRKTATTADVATTGGELPPALLVEGGSGSPLQHRQRGAPAAGGGVAANGDVKPPAPFGPSTSSATFCSLLPPPPPGVPPVAVEFIEPGLQAHRNRSFGLDLRRQLLDTWRAEDHPEETSD